MPGLDEVTEVVEKYRSYITLHETGLLACHRRLVIHDIFLYATYTLRLKQDKNLKKNQHNSARLLQQDVSANVLDPGRFWLNVGGGGLAWERCVSSCFSYHPPFYVQQEG